MVEKGKPSNFEEKKIKSLKTLILKNTYDQPYFQKLYHLEKKIGKLYIRLLGNQTSSPFFKQKFNQFFCELSTCLLIVEVALLSTKKSTEHKRKAKLKPKKIALFRQFFHGHSAEIRITEKIYVSVLKCLNALK